MIAQESCPSMLKGVEFGVGFEAGRLKGSQVMDEILWSGGRWSPRRTNNLGGFEGGMTNGQPIVVRGVMKPIPTLYKPLMSAVSRPTSLIRRQQSGSDPSSAKGGVVMESGGNSFSHRSSGEVLFDNLKN